MRSDAQISNYNYKRMMEPALMKKPFFCIDKQLRICSWEEEIAEFTGRPASSALGHKYYDVFPRLLTDKKDALSRVIKSKKALTLKKYSFPGLYGGLTTDIKIKPAKASSRNSDQVIVAIHPHAGCAVAKKLQQSKKLIDIGKIASTLAHGVRNPLNALKGAVVYLGGKYAGEETLVEFTKIMEDEISRLEDFISRFLSSSVSETEVSETDINTLLKKIEVFTSLQIFTKNIHSHYEFGNLPPITMNSFHLEQAILNVINNAIDAMKNGGNLHIRSFTEERADKLFVVIAIADTGPGIPDNKVAGFATESTNNGRGFGLFITHEILKHYGGHIEIDSKKDVGTTITLFIPCNKP
jgi:two-component system nitrogen regulation sensor histidine kinase GlnL